LLKFVFNFWIFWLGFSIIFYIVTTAFIIQFKLIVIHAMSWYWYPRWIIRINSNSMKLRLRFFNVFFLLWDISISIQKRFVAWFLANDYVFNLFALLYILHVYRLIRCRVSERESASIVIIHRSLFVKIWGFIRIGIRCFSQRH
jgi:hypothetical protein